MADEAPNNSAPKVDRQVLWVAIVGMAGLLVLALAALGMAFFLGRSQPLISINAGNNSQAGATQGQAATPPESRTDHNSSPQASDETAPGPERASSNLPDLVLPSSVTEDNAALPMRADTQSPPYYTTVSPVAKVEFRVRPMPDGPSGLKGPIPFRVHDWQPAADGRVASVQASVPDASADQSAYSFLPEVAYKPSTGKGKLLSIHIFNPRKTSVINGLRAPKGFQFWMAEIQVSNLSKHALAMDPDMFEIRDTDGIPYLVNPELLSADFPRSPVPEGHLSKFTAAFLVPSDAVLTALVAHEPGDGLIFSPLALQ